MWNSIVKKLQKRLICLPTLNSAVLKLHVTQKNKIYRPIPQKNNSASLATKELSKIIETKDKKNDKQSTTKTVLHSKIQAWKSKVQSKASTCCIQDFIEKKDKNVAKTGHVKYNSVFNKTSKGQRS